MYCVCDGANTATPFSDEYALYGTCHISLFMTSTTSTFMASNIAEVPAKRRRTNSTTNANGVDQQETLHVSAEGSIHQPHPSPPTQSPAHIPKRGARACTACRKGKNRCEGEVSVRAALSSYHSDRTDWPDLSARAGDSPPAVAVR